MEKWYPTVEEGNNKGIVVLVTAQKEGAITGGPAFIEAVGEKVLDAIVSENLPGEKLTTSPSFSRYRVSFFLALHLRNASQHSYGDKFI